MDDMKGQILTVSELTGHIKDILEKSFSFIWITGEVSNVHIPLSGHCYFTLKDEYAQIKAVLFKGQRSQINFDLEDGLQITGLGRLSVYEPRGDYQVIFEYLEPKGLGSLQIAFEQLKNRLAKEGLFEEQHKKELPFLPQRIGIITSITGTVIHDIIRVISRRFHNIHLLITPVKVQGEGSDEQIKECIELFNEKKDIDLIIIARGGGSIEDLHAFNSESLARQIFKSKIPIISGVGHETDFTVADFVADLRASTPSVAAELAVPLKDELKRRCSRLSIDLNNNLSRYIDNRRKRIKEIEKRIPKPKKRIDDQRFRVDDLNERLFRLLTNILARKRDRSLWQKDRLSLARPLFHIEKNKEKLKERTSKLLILNRLMLDNLRKRINEYEARLNDLNPLNVLGRGYSITMTIDEPKEIIKNSRNVKSGQQL